MKATQTLMLALAAPLAAAQDAPCSNEACTSLCNVTPSCLSTLFDPATGLCYTFSCVLDNYSKPSKFLGYQKSGASYECPPDQPVPGEPTAPPPDLVVSSQEAAPPRGAETSTKGPDGVSSSPTTHARGSTDATATDEASSGPTNGANDETGSPSDTTDDDDEADPAAPTIGLPDSAGQLGIPSSMILAPFALLLL